MTRRQAHAADLIEQLRKFTARDDLTAFEARVAAAIRRDETGSTAINGFPSSTISAGGGPGAVPVDRDNPDAGSVTLTPVEALAAQLEGAQPHDQVHRLVRRLVDQLVQGVSSLHSAKRTLDLLDKLATPTPRHETAGTGHCRACDQWCSGAVDDRLRSGYCDACRKAWEREGRPDRVAFEHNRPKVDAQQRVPKP